MGSQSQSCRYLASIPLTVAPESASKIHNFVATKYAAESVDMEN